MKVYVVLNDWATQDDQGIVTKAFDTIEKAREELNAQIKEEQNEYWVQAFDNGVLTSNYVEDVWQDYYSIYEDGYYCSSHTTISIHGLEVM